MTLFSSSSDSAEPEHRSIVALDRRFHVVVGSVAGREHRRRRANNQDAVDWRMRRDLLVAAVADGCSSGRFSEVGARLSVRWLAEWAFDAWYRNQRRVSPDLAHGLCDGLVGYLRLVGGSLGPSPCDWPRTVEDFLLCTILVAVVDVRSVLVFGVGDGVVSVNGQPTVVTTGPSNAPPYLAYRLLAPSEVQLDAAAVEPRIHLEAETASVESIVIGTDGCEALIERAGVTLKDGRPLGGLTEFEREPRYVRNRSLLQKRLAVAGEVSGLLGDDTSLVVIRRGEE